ncbi:interleukin-1 receptor type 1 [Silurus meridionalis]|nr:interleukin-1 receptor type 1 [Silurus meridionalis]XP_046701565.1 interleukin-1 receptor type 1 [Silurus meridionalis]
MAVESITLLFFTWIISVGAASHNESLEQGFCIDHGATFERVFAVPHEAALLDCELVKDIFLDYLNIPYNVTWYNQMTGLKFTGEENHVLLHGSSLMFLNISMEHQGHYLCIVRTPKECYKQVRVLVVEEMMSGACRRPQTALQRMHGQMNDNLRCPLSDFTSKVDSYSIHWYKGCELLQEGSRFHFTDNNLMLNVFKVSPNDAGFYTCKMIFNVSGVSSVATETIECDIVETRSKKPQMIEPTEDTLKIAPGSAINKACRVFLPGKGVQMMIMSWDMKGNYVSSNTSERIHQEPLRELEVAEGWQVERILLVSQVLEKDFNLNFTCRAVNRRGTAVGYFVLQPADPDLILPIAFLATTILLLFVLGFLLYREFKVEFALLFRTLFPFLYPSSEGDGKLYDAYVVYPRIHGDTLSEAVEAFAVKTLPKVLEERYGYRLFILGRDNLPGQAMADVVEETMNLCRRLLLLYTGSSLTSSDGSSWLEQQAGFHQALLDDSLSVMLLEMEQLSDPSILPESLRLLRDKQGALQAWNKQWNWRCTSMKEATEENEKSLSSFTLSARFWRKVRYYMPVRGKAKLHSKRKFLFTV